METVNISSAGEAPADRLMKRRRQPRDLAISAEDKALGAMYEEQMERGEFDYAGLDRAIAAAG